ncbi:response regulator [Candidatus Kaiserbacteria bacterium]|nr:response regulator [Candidatus Kaiserbacteria bacterium]
MTTASAKRVFLVEDDEFLSSMLMNQLAAHNISAERFGDGRTASEALKKDPPHLLILDLFLPDISGFEILEMIRKDEHLKDLPVLVVSNTSQVDDKERVHRLGATFLLKVLVTPQQIAEHAQKMLAA